jgi:hypothetical protein
VLGLAGGPAGAVAYAGDKLVAVAGVVVGIVGYFVGLLYGFSISGICWAVACSIDCQEACVGLIDRQCVKSIYATVL